MAPAKHRYTWTAADDRYLRNHWGEEPIGDIAYALARTRNSVHHRASELNLGLGVPQGFLSVRAASRRTGYSHQALERILAWAKVPIHLRDGPAEPGARPRRHVCYDAVEGAIARWLKSETVNGAARARGLCNTTLAKWLREAEVIGSHTRGVPHRVRTDTINRVVFAHRPAGM